MLTANTCFLITHRTSEMGRPNASAIKNLSNWIIIVQMPFTVFNFGNILK